MPQPKKPPVGAVLRAGLIATAAALGINAVLYFVGSLFGWFPETVLTPMGEPLTIVNIVLLTAIGGVAGTLVYLLLSRFLAKTRADTVFMVLAVLVIVAMAITPLQLPGAPVMMIVMLEIMHLVAGGLPVYFLTRTT